MSFDLKLENGDLVIKNSQIQTIINSEKLIQDILKICLTDSGSNPLHPWYGSYISKSVVGNALEPNITIQIAQSQLQTALENLVKLQKMQLNSLQRVSASEHIAAITQVIITQNNIDPRLYNVSISVLSKNLQPVSTSFNISTI